MKYSLKTLMLCAFLLTDKAYAKNIDQNIAQNIAQNIEQEKSNIVLDHKPKIVSSINPIYQIASFISGDKNNNSLLFNPRSSEQNYSIRSNEINNLNQADAVFYISDNFEVNLSRALSSTKPQAKIVQLIKSKNIKTLTFQSRPNEDSTDANIWLNPENAVGIAIDIAETLSKIYPQELQTYKKNLEQFKKDVRDMDQKNKISLLEIKPKSFVVDLGNMSYFENYYSTPAAAVMRYSYDQDVSLKNIETIKAAIKRENVTCVVGSFQERSGLGLQIARNNKIKFALLDAMGSEVSYGQNGYVNMMTTLVSELVKCSKK